MQLLNCILKRQPYKVDIFVYFLLNQNSTFNGQQRWFPKCFTFSGFNILRHIQKRRFLFFCQCSQKVLIVSSPAAPPPSPPPVHRRSSRSRRVHQDCFGAVVGSEISCGVAAFERLAVNALWPSMVSSLCVGSSSIPH